MSTEPTVAMNLPSIPDSQLTTMEVSGFVTILAYGHPILGFSRKDQGQRDVVIVSMALGGCSGVAIAKLCGVKPSWVTLVKQRYESGGMAALLPKRAKVRKKAAAKVLVGPARDKAKSMRRRGHAIDVIAKELGAPVAHVKATLIAEGMGPVGRGGRYRPPQLEMEGLSASAKKATRHSSKAPDEPQSSRPAAPSSDFAAPKTRSAARPRELNAEVRRAPDGLPHFSRYAGTLLLTGQLGELGLGDAVVHGGASRPERCVYSAPEIAMAFLASTVSGFGSIESMHERDAHSLGIVLGRERSPSVRTFHRAFAQMTADLDVAALGARLIRKLAERHPRDEYVFGIDGHFVPYDGKAPIDKGWNSKKRIAQRGQLDMVATDEHGRVWHQRMVESGDSLAQHLVKTAGVLRSELPVGARIVFAFDRGGIDLDILNELDAADVGYVGWLPASVKAVDLASVAPAHDGFGECRFVHTRVTHAARLVVQRDGSALLPVVTNLEPHRDATQVVHQLRCVRGMQENGFKSARSHVYIDRRSDRGVAHVEPDTRIVDNPAWLALKEARDALETRLVALGSCRDQHTDPREAQLSRDFAAMHLTCIRKNMRVTKAHVPKNQLVPGALRAVLKTRRRSLIVPLKYAAENAIRELTLSLGAGLAPSDAAHDATALSRTMIALIQAPGTVRFHPDSVEVHLELALPPKPHDRLARALIGLDSSGLRYLDDRRSLRVRLAPRRQAGL